MSERKPVIAIDGPAGAGKSTTAKALAIELGLRYLDTGAMYRAVALAALRNGISCEDETALTELLSTIEIDFGGGDPQRVLLNGEDITGHIRTLDIGEMASSLSVHGRVREALVARQQAMIAAGGVVLEGRDATTVIAPDADLKIYLTASLEERARRRTLELTQKADRADFGEVREQILQRDHRDITRTESPLKVAEDAIVVESGGHHVHDVVTRIIHLLEAP
jgi:CMP/dCMP kinase